MGEIPHVDRSRGTGWPRGGGLWVGQQPPTAWWASAGRASQALRCQRTLEKWETWARPCLGKTVLGPQVVGSLPSVARWVCAAFLPRQPHPCVPRWPSLYCPCTSLGDARVGAGLPQGASSLLVMGPGCRVRVDSTRESPHPVGPEPTPLAEEVRTALQWRRCSSVRVHTEPGTQLEHCFAVLYL